MTSFHNDQKIKDKYLSRVRAHALADEIEKGYYWEDGKGCAVGCTIHGDDHKAYETELGIPLWLARIEDRIFEGLPNERAKKWPLEFLEAISPGVDLDEIKIPFLIFIVESALEKFDHNKFPKQAKAIKSVIKELKRDILDIEKLRSARAADVRAAAADAAAAYAAAAYAAAAAAAYAADAAAARQNEYVKFADKLLELFRELKCEK